MDKVETIPVKSVQLHDVVFAAGTGNLDKTLLSEKGIQLSLITILGTLMLEAKITKQGKTTTMLIPTPMFKNVVLA